MPSLLYSLKSLCKKIKICIIAEYKNTTLLGELGPYPTMSSGLMPTSLRSVSAPFFWGREAGSPSNSNTMLLGSRPASLPSGILIHPTVWPKYTNVTDRQRSDSIGRTVLQTVAQKINYVKCGFSSAATSEFYLFKICTSADPHFTPGLFRQMLARPQRRHRCL